MKKWRLRNPAIICLVSLGLLFCIDQILLLTTREAKFSFWNFLPRYGNHPSIFVFHPEVGFLLDPGKQDLLRELTQSKEIPSNVDYNLNDHGFRRSSNAPEKELWVNVYGDSFTFGLFLGEGENFVSLLNKWSTNCGFRNYGVPGYDFRQMLKLSTSKIPTSSDNNIVVFISDDISRMTRKNEINPFVDGRSIQKIAELLPNPTFFSFLYFPNFLYLNSFLARKLYDSLELKFWQSTGIDLPIAGILSQFNFDESTNPPQFVHIPMVSDYKSISANAETPGFRLTGPFLQSKFVLKNSIGRLEIQDLNEIQKYYFKNDPHPNALGAIWIAEEISNRLGSRCAFRTRKEAL